MCFWSKKCCMWRLSKGGHQELFLLPHKAVQSKYVVDKNVLVSYMYLIIDWIISVKVRCGDLIKAWSLTTARLCGRSIQKLNTVVKTNHIEDIYLHIEENNDPKELPTRIFHGSLLNFESNISYFNANFHLFKS